MINLTGQKFGRLTVLEDGGRKGGEVLWKCLCECGNTVDVIGSNLRRGNTKSCGCLQKERTSETNKKDLTNQKFGRLTVLEDVGRTHGYVLWKCLCECGNTVNVMASSLQSGATQSCGCYNKERVSETSKIDLTGQKFGRLTVLEDVGRAKSKQVIWKCLCDCGNIVDVISGHLQSGITKSCGCLHKEQMSMRSKKENNPAWKGGITPLTQTIRHCTQYIEWRKLIFQRDDFTCGHCLVRGGKLHAHHIKRFSKIIEENHITTLEDAIGCATLWDIDNGITLCKKCHKKEHSKEKV